MTHLTASVEFHELAQGYRAASQDDAQAAYERLCEYLEGRVADRRVVAASTDWRVYHSALSECAEMLPNMKDGDPLTDAPKFLRMHLSHTLLPTKRLSAAAHALQDAVNKYVGSDDRTSLGVAFEELDNAMCASDEAFSLGDGRRVVAVAGSGELSMDQVKAIRDTIQYGDGWDGDQWDHALANAVLRSAIALSVDRNSVPSLKDTFAKAFHYPECWDTAAYPDLSAALIKVYEHYRCTQCAAPQQVDAVQAVPEGLAKAASDLLACVGRLDINAYGCTTETLNAFDRASSRLKKALALASPSPAVPPEPHSCETGQIDEALADFLAEHTSLNQDGIDTHAMKMTLALNYAALHPTPESDIAEWREQGYLPAAAQGAVPEEFALVPIEPTEQMLATLDHPDATMKRIYRAMIMAAPLAQPTDTTAGE